jgi:hypothetical protein
MAFTNIPLFLVVPPDEITNAANQLIDDINAAIVLVVAAASPTPFASYAYASLPAGSEGKTAYCTNGRKIGEGGGSGTGIPVYYSQSSWRTFSSDQPVQV